MSWSYVTRGRRNRQACSSVRIPGTPSALFGPTTTVANTPPDQDIARNPRSAQTTSTAQPLTVKPYHVVLRKTGLDGEHLERRVPGRDGADLLIAGLWPGALEEDPDRCLPPLKISAQDRHFLVVAELPAAEALGSPADAQFAGAGGTQVAHPLSFAAGRYEVTAAIVGEQVHRRGTPLATCPALHRKDPRAENADALPGKECNQLVENVSREPARRAVVIGHADQRSFS